MSKIKSSRSTGKSLGLPSERELDLWSNEGKRKASLYAKSRLDSHKDNEKRLKNIVNNQQQLQYAFNASLNTLREKTKTQKSVSSTISNRMTYLQVDIKRKKQLMELAKSKYQKMIEVRHKSFVQKQSLNKERQNFIYKHNMSVTLKASRIKNQRKNSQISVQLVREKNQKDALKIKNLRFKNEQMIANRQLMEVQKKRSIVQRQHQYSDLSRQKLKLIQQSRFQQAKKTHNFKLLQQFTKSEMQRRKNTKLIGSFREKVKKITDESKKVATELVQYQKLLGWHYSNKSPQRPNTSKTFYITNS